MGGTIEEDEEEKDNSANVFVTNNTSIIKIMPPLFIGNLVVGQL